MLIDFFVIIRKVRRQRLNQIEGKIFQQFKYTKRICKKDCLIPHKYNEKKGGACL